MEIVLADGGSYCVVIRNWLTATEGKDLWELCKSQVLWETYSVRTPVGPVAAPHLAYACGDPELKCHGFAGQRTPMHPWPPAVQALRDRVQAESKLYCNSCLMLQYRTLSDSVGRHADTECLPPYNVVVSVSIGQTRIFKLRHNVTGVITKVPLYHGDACLMYGTTQETHKHYIDKEPKRVVEAEWGGIRCVFTFRQLGGPNLCKPAIKPPTQVVIE